MTGLRQKRLPSTLLALAIVIASGGEMSAEIIHFENGRTISVKAYRESGDTVIVTFRQGGDATFRRSLIARITPDEVAYPESPVSARQTSRPTSTKNAQPARPFAELIESISRQHGVDPALTHAVIAAESNYQPRATSEVGARGLMQVMPATARELGVTSPRLLFDPRQNVQAGVRYLKALLVRFGGDVPTAVAAYNAGPAAVSKYDGIPPYPETRNYVRKVLANFQQ